MSILRLAAALAFSAAVAVTTRFGRPPVPFGLPRLAGCGATDSAAAGAGAAAPPFFNACFCWAMSIAVMENFASVPECSTKTPRELKIDSVDSPVSNIPAAI